MCLPLQIKEKKEKKNGDIQQANGHSGPKVNPHCCCFPASDCRCQLSPSSNTPLLPQGSNALAP